MITIAGGIILAVLGLLVLLLLGGLLAIGGTAGVAHYQARGERREARKERIAELYDWLEKSKHRCEACHVEHGQPHEHFCTPEKRAEAAKLPYLWNEELRKLGA